jgi:ribosomal protein S27AE
MEPPRLFWLGFIGIPLVFVGVVMCQLGFIGAVARYVAGEGAPVAADTIKYMADETKDAVETVVKSAAKGIAEGLEAGRVAATSFCPHCGFSVKTDFKFCPKCGKAQPTADHQT